MRMKQFLMVLAVMIAGTSVSVAQDIGKIDPVELKVRPQAYVGKRFSIEGRMTSSSRHGGVLLSTDKKAGVIRVDFRWISQEGSEFEKAMRECGVYRRDNVCDVLITGTLTAVENIPDYFILEKANAKFLR